MEAVATWEGTKRWSYKDAEPECEVQKDAKPIQINFAKKAEQSISSMFNNKCTFDSTEIISIFLNKIHFEHY